MNDKIWYVVRNTPGVRLIVGAETKPIPLSDAEYQQMMDQIAQSQERSELNIPYQEGDVVLSYPIFHLIGSSAVLNGAKILFLATLILAK